MSRIDRNTNQMSKPIKLSRKVRVNWWVDFAVLLGFTLAALSGFFFLVLPSSDALSDMHKGGIALTIIATVIHVNHNWKWVKKMIGRSVKSLLFQKDGLPENARLNVIFDGLIAICFLITVVSGDLIENRSKNPSSIVDNATGPAFQWTSLDLTHLWAAITLLVLLVIHLWLHRRWITNVTRRILILSGDWAGLS